VVAYHEAGHALCGELLPSVDRVHKISIVPRGRALGFTLNLPAEDRYLKTREELIDYMTVLLGGRVAEQIVFGAITTGASDDLKRVDEIADAMINDYAMGTSITAHRGSDGAVSDLTLRIRDEERQELANEARRVARRLIEAHLDKLDELAAELLEREVLDRPAIDRIMAGVPPVRREPEVGLRVAAARRADERALDTAAAQAVDRDREAHRDGLESGRIGRAGARDRDLHPGQRHPGFLRVLLDQRHAAGGDPGQERLAVGQGLAGAR